MIIDQAKWVRTHKYWILKRPRQTKQIIFFVSYCFCNPSTARIFGPNWPISTASIVKGIALICEWCTMQSIRKLKTEFDQLHLFFLMASHFSTPVAMLEILLIIPFLSSFQNSKITTPPVETDGVCILVQIINFVVEISSCTKYYSQYTIFRPNQTELFTWSNKKLYYRK